MRVVLIVLFGLLSVSLTAGGPKAFIIEGGTAVNEKPINQTLRIEANEQGQVTRVSTTAGRVLDTDIDVTYDGDRCRYVFTSLGGGGTGVKIAVDLSWKKTSAKSWEITLNQSNDVPESRIGKTVYPAKVYTRTRKIVLQETARGYTWTDAVAKSNFTFTNNDGLRTYTCIPGKSVIQEVTAKDPEYSYSQLMDGRSSDSNPITSGRMVYSRVGNKVQGKSYWAMEPIEWDGGKDFVDGGTIFTSGDSLNTPVALTNVVNYSLLSVWFDQDTWEYLGPTLFGIPIK